MGHQESRFIILFSLHDVGLPFGLVMTVPGPVAMLSTPLVLVALGSRPTT
jgi:hypothetical protein